MAIDVSAARQFLYANARLLDTHRAAHAFDGGSVEPVLAALRAYGNDDGGLGHALEPDVRTPASETTSTLSGLEVLAEVGALDDPIVAGVHDWVARIADDDGGVPFVFEAASAYPHGPWMLAGGGASHLTFGFAGLLAQTSLRSDWLDAATSWSWVRIEDPASIDAYSLKYALTFLDHTPDRERAASAVRGLAGLIGDDGSVPVPGGTDGERLTALTLSPRPGGPSRRLFTEDQIAAGLADLEAGQQDDGGWTVDFPGWSPGQAVEWRGLATLLALLTLRAEGRW